MNAPRLVLPNGRWGSVSVQKFTTYLAGQRAVTDQAAVVLERSRSCCRPELS